MTGGLGPDALALTRWSHSPSFRLARIQDLLDVAYVEQQRREVLRGHTPVLDAATNFESC